MFFNLNIIGHVLNIAIFMDSNDNLIKRAKTHLAIDKHENITVFKI